MSKTSVLWYDAGWFPACYGFCPDKKAWSRALKELGVKNEPYPETDAKCTVFWDVAENEGIGKTTILVTIGDHIDGTSRDGILGLLVHEATHVWQFICQDAGDDHPSQEAEAYAVQNIFLALWDAYQKTRLAKGKK